MKKTWEEWAAPLREKWHNVPGGTTTSLSTATFKTSGVPIEQTVKDWEKRRDSASQGTYHAVRGWYYEKYKPIFQGKKVMDIGCGLGMDGITYAQHGAKVTFVDIVESNVERVREICDFYNLSDVDFLYMENLDSLDALPKDYDFIYAMGSLMNAPFDVMKEECAVLLDHLKKGGRWIELSYPESRWIEDGSPSLEDWGSRTDHGAPWMEWYSVEKLLARLAPVEFEVLDYQEFGICDFHDRKEFNWFDLRRKS